MYISLVISTYNWPAALEKVFIALKEQSNMLFEVVIADDGSSEETAKLINNMQEIMPYPIKHVWQEDNGFQVGKIRNKAIASTQGDYITFIDHDCIPHRDFIAQHYKMAEKGFFVSYSRILLNSSLTKSIISNKTIMQTANKYWLLKQLMKGHINRFLPTTKLALGPLRKLKKQHWKGCKNLIGLWKKDLIIANGYDENYKEWGHEDSDLIVRLLQQGTQRKVGKFAIVVFHLNHPENSKINADKNWQRLQQRVAGTLTECDGLDKYIKHDEPG